MTSITIILSNQAADVDEETMIPERRRPVRKTRKR